MKLKFLLFAVLISGILNAQDTIRSLIITEAHLGSPLENFIEITNMGEEAVQLADFRLGNTAANTFEPRMQENVFTGEKNYPGVYQLPERMLQPGESFVLAVVLDYGREAWLAGIEGYSERPTNPGMIEVADVQLHRRENIPGDPFDAEKDSVTLGNPIGGNNFGRYCVFIEQMFPSGDTAVSVVIDQVMGVFDDPSGDGTNRNFAEAGPFYNVAGFYGAGNYGRLIRKFTVKTGNLNFADARGVGVDDSEWIVVPDVSHFKYQMIPWTIGNHGDYNLNENTLVPTSDEIEVDFANKKITIPWGLRRPDGIMKNMEKREGLSWYVQYSPVLEDSLTFRFCTGDKLEVIVAGADADRAVFDIVVNDPLPSDNTVIPKLNWDPEGNYIGWEDTEGSFYPALDEGITDWPRIKESNADTDTITGAGPVYNPGIPYATRIDSLYDRLDKPANASWKVIAVDGTKRADLKDGDVLKVTAENGDVKEYYIEVQDYIPGDDAELEAITWPDIPDLYRGIFGWIGDTIPNFSVNTLNYKVQVPFDVDGIPALVAMPSSLNATIEVTRATNLWGAVEDKTTTFTVTAEDDTTIRNYSVQLEKEKMPQNVEPYSPDPFLSNMVVQQGFRNSYAEICNPGNQPLDMSNYMIAHNYGNPDPAAAIQRLNAPEDWLDRYGKYIPGYKWVNEAEWTQNPGILEPDLGVNAIVEPGDVFSMGEIQATWLIDGYIKNNPGFYWPVPDQLDVQFRYNTVGAHGVYTNPWGEDVGEVPIPEWGGDCWFLFKITNDSVKRGLKPATDPNDFEVVEAFGMADGSTWNFGVGFNGFAVARKPEITRPNPVMQGSFGEGLDDPQNEWILHNFKYWASVGQGGLMWLYGAFEIGQHFFVTPTEYMSTVSSVVYKVSQGYGDNQKIWGITTETTVEQFLDNIIRPNENQKLTVTSGEDDSEPAMTDVLTNNDILTVISADSLNTTTYLLEVTEAGLSSDAVLTSDRYTITVDVQPKSAGEEHESGSGTVTGFEYGTQLKTVLDNVEVPAGAVLSVIDEQGAYVPLKRLNYDTVYVDVTVNNNTYFEVIAENGITTIVYQLKPQTSEEYAFVVSDLYNVSQKDRLIQSVPGGINVQNFLSHLVPATGATMKVLDKYGYERTGGTIARDDELVVTSANGNVTNVYFIQFLPTQYVSGEIFLAYLQSDYYVIDQVANKITGPTGATDIAEFFNRVSAAPGATATVMDIDGNIKVSGDLDDGDWIKVVAADGNVEVMYTLNLDLTGTAPVDAGNISLYPNPTNGSIHISGLETGGKIQVFNATGSVMRELKVQSTIETVSLSDQPAGMYLIVISDTHKMLGRYKVIRK